MWLLINYVLQSRVFDVETASVFLIYNKIIPPSCFVMLMAVYVFVSVPAGW